MTINFLKKKCVPCEGGVRVLPRREALRHLKGLKGWELAGDSRTIFVEWVMKDFVSAMALIQKIARLAEKEGHHPDLHLTAYRKLKVELSTHAIGGLSENDFILAAKITNIPMKLKG